MLTKEIDFAFLNSSDFEKLEVISVNHGTIFKGNILLRAAPLKPS